MPSPSQGSAPSRQDRSRSPPPLTIRWGLVGEEIIVPNRVGITTKEVCQYLKGQKLSKENEEICLTTYPDGNPQCYRRLTASEVVSSRGCVVQATKVTHPRICMAKPTSVKCLSHSGAGLNDGFDKYRKWIINKSRQGDVQLKTIPAVGRNASIMSFDDALPGSICCKAKQLHEVVIGDELGEKVLTDMALMQLDDNEDDDGVGIVPGTFQAFALMPMGRTLLDAFAEALCLPRKLLQVKQVDFGTVFYIESSGADCVRKPTERHAKATALLKDFGTTYTLDCPPQKVEIGPLAFFAESDNGEEQAILGIMGTSIYSRWFERH